MSDDDDDREGELEAAEAEASDPTEPGDPYDVLPSGTRLGRFSILGRLDSSWTDVLYAAYDAQSQRKVAVKLLRVTVTEDDADEETARLRMAREAQRIAKLDHPCVVRVHEVGVFRERVFMAMEFIDGIDLRTWMEARDDPFPWREVVRVFREAGRGLAAAHKVGIVHRDFKPTNVILGKSGRICVLDFGLSREPVVAGKDDADIDVLRGSFPGELVTNEDDPASVTRSGSHLGTAAYMAPEQHVSGKTDHRTDQFSFCIALYEALYGERPFSGNRPIALAIEVVNRKVRAVPPGSDVPPWLREVVLRGLSPMPEDRFVSMEALLRELGADPKASRRRWMRGGVVVAIGLAGVLAAVRLRQAEQTECAPNVAALQGIWDPARREQLEAAVLASGRPWALETWNTIEDRVDDWVGVWSEGTELTCLATHQWGLADEDLYDRRNRCLDRYLGEVAALSRALEAPSNEVIDNAHEIAMALRPPRLCRDDHALGRRPNPPEDLAERLASLQTDVDDVRANLHAGQYDNAVRHSAMLDRAIEPLGYAPLLVEIVLLSGIGQRALGDLAAAEREFDRAAMIATEAGLEPEVAHAYVELALTLHRLGRPEEAQRFADLAGGLVARLQLDHLGPPLATTRAEIALAQGKPSVALSQYYRAIKLESDRRDAHPLRLAPIWMRLGRLLISRGDAATAENHFSDALRILQNALGPQHPLVADALGDLARARLVLGRSDEGIESLERALKIRDQLVDQPGAAMIQLQIASALLDSDRADASIVRFADAERRLTAAQLPARAAEAAYGRGLAELSEGASAAAASTLERAVMSFEALDDVIGLADARFALARALWSDPATRKRARSVAELAELAFAEAGDAHAGARRAVADWLENQVDPGMPPRRDVLGSEDDGANEGDPAAAPTDDAADDPTDDSADEPTDVPVEDGA